MNIETLLQAAQILESQQSIPPKKRLARGECDSFCLVFFLLGFVRSEDVYIRMLRMNHARGKPSIHINI